MQHLVVHVQAADLCQASSTRLKLFTRHCTVVLASVPPSSVDHDSLQSFLPAYASLRSVMYGVNTRSVHILAGTRSPCQHAYQWRTRYACEDLHWQVQSTSVSTGPAACSVGARSTICTQDGFIHKSRFVPVVLQMQTG